MDKLEIYGWIGAINSTQILVTFSDNTTANLTLTTPLINGATTVTFTYNGITYTNQALDHAYVAPSSLQVQSVIALNDRQIKVTFNRAVLNSAAGHGALSLQNYYIGLTTDTTTTDFTKINANTGGGALAANGVWAAHFADASNNSVILESSLANEHLFATDPTTTRIGVKKDEAFKLEVRNVYSSDNTGMNTQQFVVANDENARPTATLVQDATGKAFDGTTKTVNTGSTTLYVAFNEPILGSVPGVNDPLPAADTIYLDSAPIANANVVVLKSTDTFDNCRIVKVTVPALQKGSHKISFVGVKDLANNLLTPNPTEMSFNVDDLNAVAATKPTLLDIQQTADNAFRLVFDKVIDTDAIAADNGKIVIVNADGTGVGAGDETINLNAAAPAEYTLIADAAWNNQLDANGNLVNKGKYGFALTLVKATNTFTASELSFNNANTLIRSFEVSGIATDDANGATVTGPQMDKTTRTVTINKDVTAPTLASTKPVTDDGTNLVLNFTEPPFAGSRIAVPGVNPNILVKYTDANGVLYTDDVAYSAVGGVDDTYTIDTANNQITINLANGSKLVDSSNNVIAGATYTLVLPDSLVNDGAAGPGLLDPARPHAFVGKTVTYTVAGGSAASSAPQIDQAHIAVLAGDLIQLQIFGQNIDVASVKNVANYTWDGSPMPAGTTVDFNVVGANQYALITMPQNSVKLDGNYALGVSNLATKEGYKMLPVSLTVPMVDNTQPSMTSATITASNTIKVRFDEGIANIATAADQTAAGRNFKVMVDGVTYDVASALNDADDNVVILTTSSNFNINGTVSVSSQLDPSSDMLVTDKAAVPNKAEVMTISAVKQS